MYRHALVNEGQRNSSNKTPSGRYSGSPKLARHSWYISSLARIKVCTPCQAVHFLFCCWLCFLLWWGFVLFCFCFDLFGSSRQGFSVSTMAVWEPYRPGWSSPGPRVLGFKACTPHRLACTFFFFNRYSLVILRRK